MRNSLLLAFGLAIVMGSASASAADIEAGKKVFRKCKACHSLKEGTKKVGPSLYDIVGKKAGQMKGYHYSKAMKNADITWDEKTLDEYLTKPRKYVKGTKMTFPGLRKAEDRANVIAYLKANGK